MSDFTFVINSIDRRNSIPGDEIKAPNAVGTTNYLKLLSPSLVASYSAIRDNEENYF